MDKIIGSVTSMLTMCGEIILTSLVLDIPILLLLNKCDI